MEKSKEMKNEYLNVNPFRSQIARNIGILPPERRHSSGKGIIKQNIIRGMISTVYS